MQELREPAIYQSIIEAVANGCHKTNEIASRTGLNDTRKLQPYLKTLQSINIVKIETLPTEANPKRTRNSRYVLQDPLFRFWYNFIFPYFEDVERGEGKRVKSKLDTQFASYVAYEFEEQARIAVSDLVQPDTIGRYWKLNEEIDIYGKKENKVFVGEVKWTNKKIGKPILSELKHKCTVMNIAPDYFLLISKSGFEQSLYSQDENVVLLSLDEIEGWKIERDDRNFFNISKPVA
jgi:AAA+ ATPase superfamily predicted ATPase